MDKSISWSEEVWNESNSVVEKRKKIINLFKN